MFVADQFNLELARQFRNDAERRAADHRLIQDLEADQPLRSRILRVIVG